MHGTVEHTTGEDTDRQKGRDRDPNNSRLIDRGANKKYKNVLLGVASDPIPIANSNLSAAGPRCRPSFLQQRGNQRQDTVAQ
jgi:hypothetical protein